MNNFTRKINSLEPGITQKSFNGPPGRVFENTPPPDFVPTLLFAAAELFGRGFQDIFGGMRWNGDK